MDPLTRNRSSPPVQNEARQPRLVHACILLVTAGLTSLATAVLGPSLPKMQEHFASTPGADYLVPLSLTVPMLVMALLSVFAGAAADRVGRKRILVWSTATYALCGTAPLWLKTLDGIFVSRILLGVTEAALMTVSTTMIGDYFSGAKRAKLMLLHTTVAAVAAFVLNILGGVLGEHGWRTPYMVYAISVPLALMMTWYLWEPKPASRSGHAACVVDDADVTFNVSRLLLTCAITVVVGLAFLIVPVHLGYLFAAIGIHSSAQIGIAYGLSSLGVVAGTLSFGWIVGPRVRSIALQLALATALTAVGFVGMALAGDYVSLTSTAVLNGVGAGLLLPTVVTWNMRELPFSHRGVGVGAFQSSLFLGMFVNPILIVALEKGVGTRAVAVGIVGIALLGAAAVALVIGARATRARTRAHIRMVDAPRIPARYPDANGTILKGVVHER